MMERLLTKKAVKDRVGFGFAHIDRMERDGRFPPRIRIGFRVFWREKDINDWIISHLPD